MTHSFALQQCVSFILPLVDNAGGVQWGMLLLGRLGLGLLSGAEWGCYLEQEMIN